MNIIQQSRGGFDTEYRGEQYMKNLGKILP